MFAVLDSDFISLIYNPPTPVLLTSKGSRKPSGFETSSLMVKRLIYLFFQGLQLRQSFKLPNLEFATVTEVTNTLIPNQLAQLNAATPADVTTYNTISTALQNYESNRNAVRAALKNTMLVNNFTEADISSINL